MFSLSFTRNNPADMVEMVQKDDTTTWRAINLVRSLSWLVIIQSTFILHHLLDIAWHQYPSAIGHWLAKVGCDERTVLQKVWGNYARWLEDDDQRWSIWQVRLWPGLGVNHYRDNQHQWPPLPHDNQYQWQSVPHDDHHHMTTINMPCTINTCHHYHVLFCKKIITTWQSPPHDNHHHMTITTTYLQMSPNYNCVRPGDSFIWFDLYRYSLSKPTIVVISKEYWKVFITFIIV